MPRFPRTVILDPIGEFTDIDVRVENYTQFLQVASVWSRKNFRIGVTCRHVHDDEAILELIYELGDCFILLDEAYQYEELEIYDSILRRGRHQKISCAMISHSVYDFARVHRILYDTIVCFRIDEPYELSYLRQLCGDDGTVKKIRQQKVGEYLFLRGQIGNINP